MAARDIALVRAFAYASAVAGALGIVTSSLFFSVGQPQDTVREELYLLMVLTMLPIAGALDALARARGASQLALTVAAIGVVVWSIPQTLMILGAVRFEYESPATGAYAIESAGLAILGGWLAAATVLAPLPRSLRWLGVICGLGFIDIGLGSIAFGIYHPVSLFGGIGYGFLYPLWAFLFARWLPRSAATT